MTEEQSFFNSIVIVRLRKEQLANIDKYLENHRDTYDNRSHFIRSAIIKVLKEKEGE